MAIAASNIHVGWIHPTRGYVKHKSVADANAYEKLNPGTEFIFVNGDQRVNYMGIDGVNKITVNDLLRKDPCVTRDQPCGPPALKFFGGRGIGAEGNPVIDELGQIIAVDLVHGGGGYKTAPKVQIIDPCNSGKGAVIQTEIKGGVISDMVVDDTGFGYLPPQPASPQYPALVKLKEVRVKKPGFNYNCGVDKLTITPNNGTVLTYKCDPFGKIKSVQVQTGGNFTKLPRITLPSNTGLNARFTPVFEIIRDPVAPEVLPTDVVQVYDLVGLNINGYVNGKAYYGNIYFSDGVKYAGTQRIGGTTTRVYDTIQESVSGGTN